MLSCKQSGQQMHQTQEKQKDREAALDQSLPDDPFAVYNFDSFEQLFLHQQDNQIHVINFWGTFCAPCLAEMPYFEKLNKETEVNVLLVSLDMGFMMDTRLKPYLKKHPLDAKLIVLNDPSSKKWIPKVNPDWSSSLPATLIYKNDKSAFFERTFGSYEELLAEVKKFQ